MIFINLDILWTQDRFPDTFIYKLCIHRLESQRDPQASSTQKGIEPRTFLLRGDSDIHCTTVYRIMLYYIIQFVSRIEIKYNL